MEDAILKYADRGFSYLLVIILLWRDKEVITSFRKTLEDLKLAILELAAKTKKEQS